MTLLRKHSWALAISFSAFLGAIAYLCIYGWEIIIPTNTEWLMKGYDTTQHYLGWTFYRNSEWFFPIGLFDQMSYPIPISIIFTDSIPLFAVFFKLLSPFLPDVFQYFGIWGILCLTLQGALGAALCLRFTRSPALAVLGSMLFILSPIWLLRMNWHIALGAHWLILLSILLLLYHHKQPSFPIKSLVAWFGLGLLCAGVHQYLIAMCGIVSVAYCLYVAFQHKCWYGFAYGAVFILGAAAMNYSLGFFSTPFEPLVSEDLLHELVFRSMNLNAFFDPSEYGSMFLERRKWMGGWRGEGYAYLGFGVLSLGLIAALSLVREYALRRRKKSPAATVHVHRIDLLAFGFIFVACILLAESPVVTFDDHVLFTVPVPRFVLERWVLIRGTGRMIWPASYTLLSLIIAPVVSWRSKRAAAMALLICVCVQAYDLTPLYKSAKNTTTTDWDQSFYEDDDKWAEIAKNKELKHLIFAEAVSSAFEYQFPVANAAQKHGWSINKFYYARDILGIHDSLEEALKFPRKEMIFVCGFADRKRIESLMLRNVKYWFEIAGVYVGVRTLDKITLPRLDIKDIGRAIHYRIGGNRYLHNGKDVGRTRHIYPGGLSFGPYIELHPAAYTVEIEGANLDKASYSCTAQAGEANIAMENMKVSPTKTTYQFTIKERLSRVEFLVENPDPNETVSFSSLTIYKDPL